MELAIEEATVSLLWLVYATTVLQIDNCSKNTVFNFQNFLLQ